jgi:hypothetical protein
MGVVSTKSPNGVKRGGFLGLLLAPLRHAECIEQCPSLRAKRKTSAPSEYFAF